MLAANVRPRKESGEAGFRTQVQMRAWRKKNSSQLSEFQSLYGSLNGSLTEEQLNDLKQSHITNSVSNPNNSSQSRSINRNSSREDSFYSLNSVIEDNIGQSLSDRDQLSLKDEEFKSIRDNHSILSLNQTLPNIHGANAAFPFLKNTIDEERDSGSSFTHQAFYTPKNRNSDEAIEDNFKLSQELNRQPIYKFSNASLRNSDVHSNKVQQNYQYMNQVGRYSQQPNVKASNNNPTSINNRISDTSSGKDDYSSRSSIVNHNHPYLQGYKSPKEEVRSQLGQPLIDGGQKRLKNSVQFNSTNTIDQKQQQQYYPPKLQSGQLTNSSSNAKGQQEHNDPQSLIHKKQSKVNRGKSLSTLKRMIENQQQLQQQEEVQQPNQNYFSVQSLNSSGQNNSSVLLNQPPPQKQGIIASSTNSGRLSQNSKSIMNNSIQQSPQSQFNTSQQNLQCATSHIKRFSYTVLPSPSQNPDEILIGRKISSQKQQRKKTQQKSPKMHQSFEPQGELQRYSRKESSFYRNQSYDQQNQNQRSLTPFQDQYMQEFLYYDRFSKKQTVRIAHNNRLIERKKNEVRTKPFQEQKQGKISMNLTLIISIILEKDPYMKYFLFLNHVIGAIARGFVYAFLILISIRQKFYFSIFGPAILLTRLYYIVSMYYVLFYFEQKSISFRKISKIFNNCFHLPTEYKKPVMSEMIDVMNQNMRDKEERSMKMKFIFCPAEINYISLPNQDTRKKWNLFYISNFIYQGIESICLFPLVIAFSIQFYNSDQILFGFDFLMFSRYIIVGALSIFFMFCFFLMVYGNKRLKLQ